MIGYGSIILPNTHIGNDVIVGGAVVKGFIPDDSIVVGNPCKIIGKTSDYYDREKELIKKYFSENNDCSDDSCFYTEDTSVIGYKQQ